ncbi:TonB family protein [Brevundimonas sp.]|uniref:TonB family protein n=1 Tax=Brevundimonas sp. TaxID=1871086 RepID=UPI00351CF7B7
MPEFPQRAVQARVGEGQVRLRCTLTPAGRFADCEVTSESASGVGFGPAALSAMRSARFEPVAGGPQPGDAYEAMLRFYAPPELRRR